MVDKTPLPYAKADTDILSQVFSPFPELHSFINWQPQWSAQKAKWLKRPVQNITLPEEHLSIHGAANRSSMVGLVCSLAHSFIAIDIDGVNPATPVIRDLLLGNPTYIEASPSGKTHHLRVIYRLTNPEDKGFLRPKTSIVPKDQPYNGQKAVELFCSSSNFVTLTGQQRCVYKTDNLLENLMPAVDVATRAAAHAAPSSIASIDLNTLLDLFPEFAAKTNPAQVIDIKTKHPMQMHTPPVPSSTWLAEVPCARENPELLTFLGKHTMTYHDYWLFGIMAIHAAHGSIQGFAIADAWSKQAEDDYDYDELAARWTSVSSPDFTPQPEGLPAAQPKITAATYQWLFNEFSIQWPVYKGKTKIPKPDEFENFQAFLKYKGLTPRVDALTQVLFLDGENYCVIPTYYSSKKDAYSIEVGDLDRLAVKLVMEAQPYKFRPSSGQVCAWLRDLVTDPKNQVNRFAREIASMPLYDPSSEPDYLQIMGTDIIQRNEQCEDPTQEFHELLVRKWLISLGRNLWSDITRHAPSEGILILSSPKGGIGKSSFGIRLFPPEWQHLHVVTKPQFSGRFVDKDSVQKTIGKLVVDFDEAERVFNYNDTSETKAYLTERFDVLRLPYGRDVTKNPRFFSCMASTNMTDLIFPNEGARRYWWLNVNYVDTYAMDQMDMYNMWRQIYYVFKTHTGKRAPFILTQNEVKYLESYLTDHSTVNSTALILEDIFDFSPSGFKRYTDGRKSNIIEWSMSLTEIQNIVVTYDKHMKLRGLAIELQKLLAKRAPTFYISGKKVTNGIFVMRRQRRYFMPELRNDALKRAAGLPLD